MSPEHPVGVFPQRLHQMGGENGRRLHHRVTGQFGPLLLPASDPNGRKTERGIRNLYPLDLLLDHSGVHSHIVSRPYCASNDFDASQFDHILVGFQLKVISDPDLRDDNPQLRGTLPSDAADPFQQVAALLGVHQTDQTVPYLYRYGIHRQKILRALLGVTLLLLCLCHLTLFEALFRVRGRVSDGPGDHTQEEEGNPRKPRRKAQQKQDTGRYQDRFGLKQDLPRDVLAQVRLRRRPGDDDARRRGEYERGDLTYQAVPDRQYGVGAQRLCERHASLQDPDDEPPKDIDERDRQSGDRVASDELAGPVHGAVEVRLSRDLLPSPPRLDIVDQPRVEVRVDAHLFPRHGVQREASGHLCDPRRALGDDHELDDDQDNEHHEPDDVVPLDHECAERGDDLPGKRVAQDQPGRCDIEGETV